MFGHEAQWSALAEVSLNAPWLGFRRFVLGKSTERCGVAATRRKLDTEHFYFQRAHDSVLGTRGESQSNVRHFPNYVTFIKAVLMGLGAFGSTVRELVMGSGYFLVFSGILLVC